jgi:hypothetical protein
LRRKKKDPEMATVTRIKPTYVMTEAQFATLGAFHNNDADCLVVSRDTRKIRLAEGGKTFAQCLDYGGGSAGGGALPAGSAYQVQFNSGSSTFAADAEFLVNTTQKALLAPQIGTRVHAAGAIASPWEPPVTQHRAIITGNIQTDIEVRVPTYAPTTGYYFEWTLMLTNISDAVRNVTWNVSAGQWVVNGFSAPPKKVRAGETAEFTIYTTNAGATWSVYGAPASRYDLAVDGYTPAAGEIVFERIIRDGLLVPLDTADTGTPWCGSAPTAQTVFSLQRLPWGDGQAWSQIGTCTFGSGQSWGAWSFPAYTTFGHEDRVRLVAPANLNGLQRLMFTLACVA